MRKFLKVLPIFLAVAALISCSDNGSDSTTSGGGDTPSAQGAIITIDNAGVVPVINNAKTTSVVYVHNNSSKVTINNISYTIPQSEVTVQANSNSKQSKQKTSLIKKNYNSTNLLSTTSASQCSTIAPMQSCPIQFTTPALTASQGQGSMLLTLSYNYNGQHFTFNQIINFQAVNTSTEQGVFFNSGVDISGFGNTTGYGTVYVYGGGTDQIYTLSSLSSNKAPITISNGNITGQEIASNFVQAVEVASPVADQNTIEATLTLASTNNQSHASYSSNASVGISPVTSGGILISGQVAVIDTSESSNPGSSMLISNAGNTSVTLGTSSATTGISNLSGCTSGTVLAVGGTCTITFNVTQASGSGTITLNYTGGSSATSITQAITWYNSLNGALASLTYTSPMNFPQDTTKINKVTVTNIGGYNLTNITIPTPQVFGNATVTVTYPATGSCQNATLNIGESCSYNLNIRNSSIETNKQIVFGVTGSYDNGSAQTYTRYGVITYSTVALAPTLVITPNPANSMTITGNNTNYESQVLTVSNVGNAAATISSQGVLSPYNIYFNTISCASSLESSTSCSVTVILESYAASQQISGTAIYNIAYSGGVSSSLTATDNIPFTITANQQSLTIESVSATGATSGAGTSGSAYSFSGNVTSQSVTFTLLNSGTNSINITGIQNATSALAWYLNLAQSTCYNLSGMAPSAKCTIVYNNVLNENTLAISGLGSSYTENITVPGIVFDDAVATGTQFITQPSVPSGGTTVYATASLATVTNSVTVLNPGTTNTQLRVQNVLTNATGYTPITITTSMEDYFSGVVSTSGSCTQSSSNAVRTQVCTLSSGSGTGSITYRVESAYIESQSVSLHTLFDMSNSSQIVGMSSSYISTTIQEQ
ncbi:MAG: hypothetical protein QG673_600 [Pseudomonadota bacterium]|nr:hypothetical protein [Pseudomonadota bacterium]